MGIGYIHKRHREDYTRRKKNKEAHLKAKKKKMNKIARTVTVVIVVILICSHLATSTFSASFHDDNVQPGTFADMAGSTGTADADMKLAETGRQQGIDQTGVKVGGGRHVEKKAVGGDEVAEKIEGDVKEVEGDEDEGEMFEEGMDENAGM